MYAAAALGHTDQIDSDEKRCRQRCAKRNPGDRILEIHTCVSRSGSKSCFATVRVGRSVDKISPSIGTIATGGDRVTGPAASPGVGPVGVIGTCRGTLESRHTPRRTRRVISTTQPNPVADAFVILVSVPPTPVAQPFLGLAAEKRSIRRLRTPGLCALAVALPRLLTSCAPSGGPPKLSSRTFAPLPAGRPEDLNRGNCGRWRDRWSLSVR